jgi:hypothetical protein
MPKGKRRPFSGKQKKAQQQAKREQLREGTGKRSFKADWDWGGAAAEADNMAPPAGPDASHVHGHAPLEQRGGGGGGSVTHQLQQQGSLGFSGNNGYNLRTLLTHESRETIQQRKRDAVRPLRYVHGAARFESPVGAVDGREDVPIEMPQRLPWDPSWSAATL